MRRGRSPGLSASQKAELWRRRGAGQSLSEIGRALSTSASTVHHVVSGNGGIGPRPRTRSKRVLGLTDREEISRGIAAGATLREIGARIGRPASTVSREIARHGGRGRYRATEADAAAWDRARRPKRCRLAVHGRLCRAVAAKLSQQWSPEQVSGWLKATYPDDPSMRVSPETIYRSLFIQARGVLKKELSAHLRSRRMMRKAKSASAKGEGRGQIVDAVSISERPAEIEDRAVPGHWEGDLISGSNNSHVATLVERTSRFVMLVKVRGKDTHSVVDALIRHVHKLPSQLRRSVTWDRGSEMARHKQFTLATDLKVYFCDPHSPWQRGSNENTNGLLRQYFPKGTDLSVHSQTHLNKIARRLNQRPRKTLGFTTPADRLQASVASTG
jgi:IS30 family transposase